MGTFSRVFVPLLIVALPIAAILGYVAYYAYNKTDAAPNQPAVESRSFGSAQWPVFRGDPALSGAAEGDFPDSLGLAWRFETGGAVRSTPIIAQKTVFFSSTDSVLYAVSLADGSELWRFKADDAMEAAPLAADGTVYVGTDSGTFYAVEVATGQQRWTFKANGRIVGSANTYLDSETGKRRVIFGCYDNYLYCLDVQDGTKIWEYEAQNYINGSPAVSDGAAVFGSCDGMLYVVPFADPKKTRSIDIETYMAASPAIDKGVIFAGNYEGLFQAAKLDGGEILWQFRQDNVPFVSSPAVTEAFVLFGARDKKLYALNRADGTLAWTFTAAGAIDSSPVVCGRSVVFGADDGRLYAVTLAEGRQTWTYTLGKAISAGPAMVDNTLLVGCEDGAVYAFRAEIP